MAAVAVVALAACGGGNNAANGNAPANDDDHGHGHGDEHGEAHEIGEKKIGDYDVHVARVEGESKTEAVYEIKVMKGSEAAKGKTVDVWIGDKDGNAKAPIAKGEWMEEEGLYDCHVELPADLKDMRLWVKIREGDLKPADFDIDHD
jgi:hypothetical protein